MTTVRVLVVEDEGLIARDIVQTLVRLGYDALGPVATGEAAIEKARGLSPDLVLMDIRLKGELSGIEAAEVLRRESGPPVIFLTAHSDSATLERAKLAEPFGYVLKPFEETDLRTAIEVALYKHRMDKRLRRREEFLTLLFESMQDSVVGIDETGKITFLNKAAEALLGADARDAIGKSVMEVVSVQIPGSDGTLRRWVRDVATSGVARRIGPQAELSRRSRVIPVEGVLAPMRTDPDSKHGALLVLRDVSAEERIEMLVRERDALRAKLIKRADDLV